MISLVTTETHPKTKIINSLPTPRSDDSTCNNNAQILVLGKRNLGNLIWSHYVTIATSSSHLKVSQ